MTLRMAVAQTTVPTDPRHRADLHAAGNEIRRLMRAARRAGARLIHFSEGATCSPHKMIMSVNGPDVLGPADWSRFEWAVLHRELAETARLAGELGLWTVLGSVHRLTDPHRPHNSLYVISDTGEVVTRYDERMLSNTKVTFMYTPGAGPVTFQVDGVRFGCTLGMEAHYPELFGEYERLDVDCVLFSTHGPGSTFAMEAQAHAATNSFWVSYATTAQEALNAPSGVVSPDGVWLGRCPQTSAVAFTVVDLDLTAENLARPWRRTARGGLYEQHLVRDDPRSVDRGVF